jgi:hypothetical protein
MFLADSPDGIWFRRPAVLAAARVHRAAARLSQGRTRHDTVGPAGSEDVDWSLGRPAGCEARFVPDAIAWHHVSASTGGERASTHAPYHGSLMPD